MSNESNNESIAPPSAPAIDDEIIELDREHAEALGLSRTRATLGEFRPRWLAAIADYTRIPHVNPRARYAAARRNFEHLPRSLPDGQFCGPVRPDHTGTALTIAGQRFEWNAYQLRLLPATITYRQKKEVLSELEPGGYWTIKEILPEGEALVRPWQVHEGDLTYAPGPSTGEPAGPALKVPSVDAVAYVVTLADRRRITGRRCGIDFGREPKRVPASSLTLAQRSFLLNSSPSLFKVVEILGEDSPRVLDEQTPRKKGAK